LGAREGDVWSPWPKVPSIDEFRVADAHGISIQLANLVIQFYWSSSVYNEANTWAYFAEDGGCFPVGVGSYSRLISLRPISPIPVGFISQDFHESSNLGYQRRVLRNAKSPKNPWSFCFCPWFCCFYSSRAFVQFQDGLSGSFGSVLGYESLHQANFFTEFSSDDDAFSYPRLHDCKQRFGWSSLLQRLSFANSD